MTDHNTRLERITQKLISQGLDALVIMSPSGTCYLSGCYILTQTLIPSRQAFVLLTRDGGASYLVCNIEERMARHDSLLEDLRTYVEFIEEPVFALTRMLQEKGLTNASIGLETRTMSFENLRYLREALPNNDFIPWDVYFAEIMMIKDEAEVAALESAGQKTQTSIEAGLTGADPGSSELDVAGAILIGFTRVGMFPMFNVFASGPRTLLVHGEPTNRVMRGGEIVRLDLGGRFPSHYLSDMARTAIVGEPSHEQAQDYGKLFKAQTAIIEAIKPGILVSDLYNTCAETYRLENIPFSMPHIGHGMGIGLHEDPMIHPGNQTPLQPGMVLNIEPFLFVEDRQEGYHIEDLVFVTDTGPRLLTNPQPELIRIPC